MLLSRTGAGPISCPIIFEFLCTTTFCTLVLEVFPQPIYIKVYNSHTITDFKNAFKLFNLISSYTIMQACNNYPTVYEYLVMNKGYH
jgi:hypothetical protein